MMQGPTPVSGERGTSGEQRWQEITSHRDLLANRQTIIRALEDATVDGRLLAANASLAFREAGIRLAPDVAGHVLRTMKQSAGARSRRAALAEELTEALGVPPHPSDPAWLADTLFDRLGVTPLATRGKQPVYRPAIPDEVQARLRRHLSPPSRPRLPARGSPAPRPQLVWRLDLDAEVPTLPRSRSTPKTVTLPALWFYLDVHELVRPLLQLGILEVSVMPTLRPAQFEALKAGHPTGGFLDWVDTVTFPRRRPRDGAPGPEPAATEAPPP